MFTITLVLVVTLWVLVRGVEDEPVVSMFTQIEAEKLTDRAADADRRRRGGR